MNSTTYQTNMESSQQSKLPKIKACLFDMDGLLLDSEDLYTLCTNAVLSDYGKPGIPWSLKAKLQGRPGPESYAIFQAWAQLPISSDEFHQKVSEHQTKHFPTTQPLPGVETLITSLKNSKAEIAVATSSNSRNFDLKTSHLPHLFSQFSLDHTVKGDDPRIPKGRGKPAPDIFLLALDTINQTLSSDGKPLIHPEECLVFEDSVPGVEAGRRAGMQVAWVPYAGLREVYAGREAEVLAGLTGEHVDRDGGIEEAEWTKKREEWIAAGRKFARVRGKSGEIGDGWAVVYKTLEGFPFEYYGIDVLK